MTQHRPRLREARLAASLTQQALAERVGVRQQHVARWEGGAHEPRVSVALRLAAALGTTVEALWQAPEPQTTKRGRAVAAADPVTATEETRCDAATLPRRSS